MRARRHPPPSFFFASPSLWQELALETVDFGRWPKLANMRRAVRNGRYAVMIWAVLTPDGEALHLAIRRHDGEPARDWYALQGIKNELVGPERQAVEIFPPERDRIDEANLTHLWVLPRGAELPFTLGGSW